MAHYAPVASGERFADLLQAAMDDRGLSNRGLARLIVGREADEKRLDNKRRQIVKHLRGQHVPNRPTIIEYVRAMDLPDGYFNGATRQRQADRLAELEALVVSALERLDRIEGRG